MLPDYPGWFYATFYAVFVVGAVFALWKLVEIAAWLIHNVHVSVGS